MGVLPKHSCELLIVCTSTSMNALSHLKGTKKDSDISGVGTLEVEKMKLSMGVVFEEK
jgi:hypothetical protein